MADADIGTPAEGQVVQWHAADGKWRNTDPVIAHPGSLMIGATAAADVARRLGATYFASDNTGGAGGAFDGDDSTWWGGFGPSRNVGVDLGDPLAVAAARLYQGVPGHRPDGVPPYGLTLQAWDGAAWIDLAENDDPPADWTPSFAPVAHQRWRCLFTSSIDESTWPAALYTFSLFAAPGSTSELLAGAPGTKLTIDGAGMPVWV